MDKCEICGSLASTICANCIKNMRITHTKEASEEKVTKIKNIIDEWRNDDDSHEVDAREGIIIEEISKIVNSWPSPSV